jgi:hypothetical protein
MQQRCGAGPIGKNKMPHGRRDAAYDGRFGEGAPTLGAAGAGCIERLNLPRNCRQYSEYSPESCHQGYMFAKIYAFST